MFDRQLWRHFDWWMLILVLLLSVLGIVMIYSATFRTEELADYWIRQTRFVLVGIPLLFAVALIDYRQLEIVAPVLFLFYVASLVAVYLFGESQGTGAFRWVRVGGTLVQPTEIGKFLLIISLAWYLSRFRDQMESIFYLIGALLLLFGPLALVYLQPDLGMSITMTFIGGVLIFVSGIQYWQVLVFGGAGLISIPFFIPTLSPYMVERIQIFLNPNANPDASFNVDQALIAVGSGGWLGLGWTQGSQNQLAFLRVRHTDFIFSVIAEEIGFVGTAIILLVFLLLIFRLFRVADLAQDHFGRLLVTGVASLLLFQLAVNIGMNIRIVPVTGLTLPFISYGGSSMLSMLLAIGLAESVIMRHRKIDFI
ncbi:MAG: FtsW/RodA/SpoVE family cell cycle protein [Chloroflexota bacterium]